MSFVISLDKWSFFKDVNDLKRGRTVSYTHLTLPTIYSV